MNSIRQLFITAAIFMMASSANAAHVLVVISGADHIDLRNGGSHPTGFYLNELMQPVILLQDAGHQITFATPDGRIPTLDRLSVNVRSFGGDNTALTQATDRLERLQLLSPTASPVISLARAEQIGIESFDAIFIPGGHAPMQDLSVDSRMGRILASFHQANKPTALVCHGPIALLSAVPDAASYANAVETGVAKPRPDWIYAGYHLTVISNRVEEAVKGMFQGDAMKFYPQDALTAAGASFSEANNPLDSYVVEDRELITGENPASALAVGKALLARLRR